MVPALRDRDAEILKAFKWASSGWRILWVGPEGKGSGLSK